MGETNTPSAASHLVSRDHSRPAGDVVLASLPPYFQVPWMPAGIPLLSTVLEQDGLKARLVRFLDNPFDSPAGVIDAMHLTLWGDPPLSDRLARMRAVADRHPEFFESILGKLLTGPESIFAFSVWRINVDVVLEVTRRLKERRP